MARKTQPSAAAGKASTSDPDYQPPEGAPEGDTDEESVSDTEDVINPLIDQDIFMIAMPLTLLMPDTIPRQASKPAQQKTSATVASNLGPNKSLKHMKSSMLDRCEHALSAIKSQKVMTSALFINATGPNMRGGTCTSALLSPVPLMATHMVMMNSTLFGGICRRTMACSPPWVVPNVMGPSAVSKHSRNIYQTAWAKR